jgi:TrmH RNA methyltransferase
VKNKRSANRAGQTRPNNQRFKHAPREVKMYGLHACLAVYRFRADDIVRVYAAPYRKKECGALLKYCAERRLAYHLIEDDELEKVAGSLHHEGLCMLVREAKQPQFVEWLTDLTRDKQRSVTLLYLEGVENPHNFGAILRVCAHFGASAVLLSAQSELSLAGAASRVAEGGAEVVPILYLENPARDLSKLKAAGFSLVATVVNDAQSIFEHSWPRRSVIMFGSEAKGLSPSARNLADVQLTIPGTGQVESLNVACSTAVVLAAAAAGQTPNPNLAIKRQR